MEEEGEEVVVEVGVKPGLKVDEQIETESLEREYMLSVLIRKEGDEDLGA